MVNDKFLIFSFLNDLNLVIVVLISMYVDDDV
jgi:hypothetical protein